MLQDVAYAIRALRRAPLFTGVALLVLTLGIGATTAIFSVVDAVVLRGLPFDEGDRLVSVTTRNPKTGSFARAIAPQDFLDWRARQDVFAAFAATAGAGYFTVRDRGRPEALSVLRATADFFDVLRVRPALGRPFTKDQVDGNHRVVILSDDVWRRFGADPDIVGRTMTFDSEAWEVIAVMPRNFAYPIGASEPAELWVPLVIPADQRERGNRQSYHLQSIARLKDGVSVEQAGARMELITAGLARQYPNWFTDRTSAVRPLHEALIGDVRPWMLMLLGAAGFVLLIACVNVANLMLARGTARSREISVRAALGASRWQIARGLLAESLVLSAAGGVCASFAAWWGVGVLRAALPHTLPRIADVAIDLRVLAVAAVGAVVTGVLFGLAPAVQFSSPNLAGALREGGAATAGRTRQLLRSSLVVAEVALAVVLLVGAGLFLRSFVHVTRVDIGLDDRNVLTMGIYPQSGAQDPALQRQTRERLAFSIGEIVDRVKNIPGVEGAAFISGALPLSGGYSRTFVRVPGEEEQFRDDDAVDARTVTADYATVMGTPLRRGRYLSESDVQSAPPVVVLNEEAARRYLGGRDPIGAQIIISGTRTVVGVVGNVRLEGPERAVRPEAYLPIGQRTIGGGDLVVRTADDPAVILGAVRRAIWASLPDTPIQGAVTMETLLGRVIAQRRFNTLLVGLFAVLGVVIAAAGIYGVMGYIVTQQMPEMGVRIALGAAPSRVLKMVLIRASSFLVVGLAVGLAGAWGLAGLVERFLFDVAPHDPIVLAGAMAVLLTSGLLSALVPALRASRADPLLALRSE